MNKGQIPSVGSDGGFGFAPSDLLASYPDWKKYSDAVEHKLRPETREWLYEWRMWDLACSPMDDDERRRTRYGHHLGWHAALKPNAEISHGGTPANKTLL